MKTKLAILCLPGLDNFLQWADHPTITENFEVKKFMCHDNVGLEDALKWPGKDGIVWLEWCNELAVIALGNPSVKLNAKTVVRLHSYEVFTPFPSQVNWNAVDKVVFVAYHVLQMCQNNFPNMKSIIHNSGITIPNGVDMNVEQCGNPESSDIAVVGSINYKKAPEMILQIANLLPEEMVIHWAGNFQDARYELYLKHMVKEMGIENRVKFYGHVDDMSDFWKNKRCLLHTTLHEGHCVSVLEAMARGIQPIVHNFWGAKEQYKVSLKGGAWLFGSIREAARMILSNDVMNTSFKHDLESKGWTLDAQADSICKMLNSLF